MPSILCMYMHVIATYVRSYIPIAVYCLFATVNYVISDFILAYEGIYFV